MHRRSVRDQFVFSIGFATSRRRDLLCRIQPSSVRDARQHSLNGWFCDLEQSGSERRSFGSIEGRDEEAIDALCGQ
jgi:hypothetical protein